MEDGTMVVGIIGGVFAVLYAVFIVLFSMHLVKEKEKGLDILTEYYKKKAKDNKEENGEEVEEAKKESDDFSESLRDNKTC